MSFSSWILEAARAQLSFLSGEDNSDSLFASKLEYPQNLQMVQYSTVENTWLKVTACPPPGSPVWPAACSPSLHCPPWAGPFQAWWNEWISLSHSPVPPPLPHFRVMEVSDSHCLVTLLKSAPRPADVSWYGISKSIYIEFLIQVRRGLGPVLFLLFAL